MKIDRTYEAFADKSGRWRWRTRASNGRITSTSGESFASRRNAMRAARREYEAICDGVVMHKEALTA